MTSAEHRPTLFPACEDVHAALSEARRFVKPRSRLQRVRIAGNWSDVGIHRWEHVCFISCVSDLTSEFIQRAREVRRKVKETAFLLLLSQSDVAAISEHAARLGIQNPERIQFVEADTDRDRTMILTRFLSTLSTDEPKEQIFEAWWEKDDLVVCSPRFNRLRVPRCRIPVFHHAEREMLHNYEIDEDGSFVFWPDLDVHLGWQQLLAAVDEKASLRAKQRWADFNRRYGEAIRATRKEAGLRQADIGKLTPRHVGRIERGECRATLKALRALADAHGLELDDYLARLSAALPAPG